MAAYRSSKLVSVLVPAFNEAENIEPLAEEFSAMIRKTRLNIEVIVIDDGSTDGTAQSVRSAMKRYRFLKLVQHNRNLGKTEAVLSGYSASGGEYIVIFDADLQFDPFDIPAMVKRADEGYDLVTGRKTGKYQKPIVSAIYNHLCRLLFKVPVHDLNSMKLFRREVLLGLTLREDWHRYMVVLALDKGFKVSEIPIKLRPRKFGESKYTGLWRVFVGLFDLVAVWFSLKFMKKPMLFFGTLGLLCLVLGFLVGIIAIVLRFGYQIGYRPLLTLIVFLAQAGFSLLLLGFLAEMIRGLQERIEMSNTVDSKGRHSRAFTRQRDETPNRDKKTHIENRKNESKKRKRAAGKEINVGSVANTPEPRSSMPMPQNNDEKEEKQQSWGRTVRRVGKNIKKL